MTHTPRLARRVDDLGHHRDEQIWQTLRCSSGPFNKFHVSRIQIEALVWSRLMDSFRSFRGDEGQPHLLSRPPWSLQVFEKRPSWLSDHQRYPTSLHCMPEHNGFLVFCTPDLEILIIIELQIITIVFLSIWTLENTYGVTKDQTHQPQFPGYRSLCQSSHKKRHRPPPILSSWEEFISTGHSA